MSEHRQIEPVLKSDYPRIVEVWEASVRATHDFLSEANIAYLKPLVRDTFLDLVTLSCLRDARGEIVAFSGVAGGKLEMLFVDPAHRGQGAGRQLVEHAIKVQDMREVDVNEQNEQAVGFYRRMGLVVTGRSETDSLGLPFPLLHMCLPEGG